MRFREFAVTALAACAIGWFAKAAWSEDPPADPGADWIQFAQPGEPHAKLKPFVGEWSVRVKMFEGDKVTESESTASFTMILGDRYLQQVAKGAFQGMPFEGRGWIGYDNGKKRYVSAWIDNFGTGIMLGDGEETQPGKQWAFKSTFVSAQGPITTKDVMTIVSDKELTWESWMGDSEKPMMSLHYTKK